MIPINETANSTNFSLFDYITGKQKKKKRIGNNKFLSLNCQNENII